MNTRSSIRALVLTLCTLAYADHSFAAHWDVGISVGFAPPPLPVYVQPPCPAPGYIWTPGYWAYTDDADDYYWVPGTWVYAPAPGLLWTPGYWAENDDDDYEWHDGYWAPHVGFYGGINYGFGYFGVGFEGGYWRDRDFYYNRAVANVVNVNVTNIYSTTVINRFGSERTSYNGRDGIQARPTRPELQAQREPHQGWTAAQQSHIIRASNMPDLRAAFNQGRPAVAATVRPGIYEGRGVVAARAAPLASSNSRGFTDGSSRGFRPTLPGYDARSDRPSGPAGAVHRGPSTPQFAQRNDRPAWAAPGRADADPSRRIAERVRSASPAPVASSNSSRGFTNDYTRGIHPTTPGNGARFDRPSVRPDAENRGLPMAQVRQRNERLDWADPGRADSDSPRSMARRVQSPPPAQLHRNVQAYGQVDHASLPLRSAAPWAAPNRDQRDQRSWHPEATATSRTYSPPPAALRWTEQRLPQVYTTPQPRMAPPPPQTPMHGGGVESRRNGRDR